MPRQGDVNGTAARKPGELPVIQDLTPPDEQNPPVPGAEVLDSDQNGLYEPMSIQREIDMGLPPNPMVGIRERNGFRGARGHGPRGSFGGDAASFRPQRRNDKTLVVEKIPEDKLSLGAINDWFKKFGTVTNVAVDPDTSKALVSFSNHEEAHAAWKSEDAVFGNRFVKVFWHRPMEGHGHLGARMLAASANLVSKVSSREASSYSTPAAAEQSRSSAIPSTPTPKPSSTSTLSALAAKQQLLEQQIAEQKMLMAKLTGASAEEKKDIMARIRKLVEDMKPSATTQTKPSTPAPSAQTKSRGSTPRTDDQVQKERERLDKELELHSAVAAVEGESEESTEELKARLAKLKEEAASLGIPDGAAESTTYYSGGHRPYRGRGRGARSYYRGAMRGGPPRGSMKLDNRPKKLLVKGVNTDQVQAVKEWYETTGQVESFDMADGGDAIVSFRSRAAAEQGLAKGSNITAIGSVQVSWYTGQPPSTVAEKSAPANRSSFEKKSTLEERASSLAPESNVPHHMEEDFTTGGWGGEDEEDYGML
ncbi:hypothetical protein EW026_g7435 [Hermanssonia centrifuga]|uniref:RRM domain-containing protein n=1 Tax=Hermanssonia centrifuga TaxID=98765 RepID=A0A4V3X9E7_9APHY|nr:hypothetical protein EW026_g7435 [Hermanssonia centrifuga]